LLQSGLQRELSRGCINSILCDSACLVYGLDTFFVGPAAVALAERYDLDSGNQGTLLGRFVVMLVHSAHRLRLTLYDGLQIKPEGRPWSFAPNRRGTSGLLAAMARHPGAAHQSEPDPLPRHPGYLTESSRRHPPEVANAATCPP
jgi:hypothetical protein